MFWSRKKAQDICKIITPIVKKLAMGDFSEKIKIPEKENEFTDLLVALNLIIDNLQGSSQTRQEAEDIKVSSAVALEQEKRRLVEEGIKKLEKKVRERTAELERAHKKMEENLKEVSRLKDEFVFVATHELKAPVSVINGYLGEMMESSNLMACIKEDGSLKGVLEGLSAAKDRLLNLTQDLLDVARIETGKFRMDIQKIDIEKTITPIIKDLSTIAESKKISLKLEVVGDMPKISTDPNRFLEVTTNLITNAIKYNKEGGSVNVKISFANDLLDVKVIDTGIGMTKEEQKHLFEKFWRSDDAQKEEGTGLGLFIVKHILEQMSGDIVVESEKGKGSIFSFTLPVNIKL